jgi:hypothetical protein
MTLFELGISMWLGSLDALSATLGAGWRHLIARLDLEIRPGSPRCSGEFNRFTFRL